jgi:hypothetical protein
VSAAEFDERITSRVDGRDDRGLALARPFGASAPTADDVCEVYMARSFDEH